jgi:hypothetical protein
VAPGWHWRGHEREVTSTHDAAPQGIRRAMNDVEWEAFFASEQKTLDELVAFLARPEDPGVWEAFFASERDATAKLIAEYQAQLIEDYPGPVAS